VFAKTLFNLQEADRSKQNRPGGDTGAVSRARRLLSAAERHLVDGIDQPIATFVERVRQQVRVLRNLAMDALQTRLYERIHEAGEEAIARRRGFRALSGFGGGNSVSAISDSNHCMSPSQIAASANVIASDYCTAMYS